MSTIQIKPFIQKVLNSLTAEQKSSLISLMNGGDAQPDFRSLINPSAFITNADKGVNHIVLETEDASYTGYLIYNNTYCVLIAYVKNTQDLSMLTLDLVNQKYAMVPEFLNILELRFELEETKEPQDVVAIVNAAVDDGDITANPTDIIGIVNDAIVAGQIDATVEVVPENVITVEDVDLSAGSAAETVSADDLEAALTTEKACQLVIEVSDAGNYPIGDQIELKRVSLTSTAARFAAPISDSNGNMVLLIADIDSTGCDISVIPVTENELANLAPLYDTAETYAIGDEVTHDGKLYKAKAEATGAWDATKWDQVTVEELLAEKLTKGTFDGTTGVGYADTAKSLQTSVGNDDETPFAFQTTGGSADVETGIQELRKLVGATVVNNQLVRNPVFANGTNYWYTNAATISVSDGKLSVTPTTRFDGAFCQVPTISGHIYLALVSVALGDTAYSRTAYVTQGSGTIQIGSMALTTSKQIVANVITATHTQTANFSTSNGGTENWVADVYDEFLFIDLTQRYGNNDVVNAIIGNDSSKYVEKLLQFDPSILKQTAYDAGTLVSSQSATLKSVGYNAFDGEWVIDGGYNTFTFKNYVRVQGGQEYTAECGNTTTLKYAAMYFDCYDINKNLIGNPALTIIYAHIGGGGSRKGTLPANCAYVKVRLYSSTAMTEGPFSFHLTWDSSKTGYEPYETQTYDLPNIVQRGILKVDASGNVYADGDEYYPDGREITRYKTINLWEFNFTNWIGSASAAYGTLSDIVSYQSSQKADAISNKFEVMARQQAGYSADDYKRSISVDGQYLLVMTVDANITSIAELKTYLQSINATFTYKLATPVESESTPFPENVWADDFGTMQFLDGDGNQIAGLQGADFFYKANIAGFAESIYARDDIHGDPSQLVSHTELSASVYTKAQADARFALKEALGGTLRQVLATKESLDFGNTAYVDLGELDWAYDSDNGRFYSETIADLSLCTYGSSNPAPKMVCTKYETKNTYYLDQAEEDKLISTNNTAAFPRVFVKDTTLGTNATEFKAALKGVLLAYEKAS